MDLLVPLSSPKLAMDVRQMGASFGLGGTSLRRHRPLDLPGPGNLSSWPLDQADDGSHADRMTKLPAARAESTEAFLAKAGPDLAALCTACGACFDACPMADHVGLRGADPKALTEGLRRLATGAPAGADTVAWVGACAKSGRCVTACPERSAGLDAMLLVRIAKRRALVDTHQLAAKQDPTYFPRIKTFARLQLSDEEQAEWL